MNKADQLNLKIIEYINKNDIFWSYDLRNHLGIVSEHRGNGDDTYYSSFIKKLINLNLIQCCERKANSSQYIRLKLLNSKDLLE